MKSSPKMHVTFSGSEGHCPFGFSYDQGRCYKYEGLKDETMSMSQARSRCLSYNDDASNLNRLQFDLVSVRDETENDFVSKILRENGNRNPNTLPWVGLHKNTTDSWNNPTWSDGSLVIYTKWSPNSPSEYQVGS